ncbi:MAG: DUF3179 domain-containing protein [Paracoccaceae bacterium]
MLLRNLATAVVMISFAGAAMANPDAWRREWPLTDFTKTNVAEWSEIMGGGPSRDGIPALDNPSFLLASEETRIGDREPVVTVQIDGEVARTYPLRYLVWHEIVNDESGGFPYAVTYCPLCNSVPVFDRRVNGEVLNFGVSGKLRQANLIMFDRQTESWWQQATGEGIVGAYTGAELTQIASWQESFAEFRENNPQGLVMDEPNWRRAYGRNPYVGYDGARQPFLFNGEDPPFGVPSLARVVRVGERAWPVGRLAQEPEVNEAGLTITWNAGQASALDTRKIADGRDIGTIRVRDAQGNDVPHDIIFAFSFNSFWPDGEWMMGNWTP